VTHIHSYSYTRLDSELSRGAPAEGRCRPPGAPGLQNRHPAQSQLEHHGCLSVCLSVCFSFFLPVSLSVCMYVVCLFVEIQSNHMRAPGRCCGGAGPHPAQTWHFDSRFPGTKCIFELKTKRSVEWNSSVDTVVSPLPDLCSDGRRIRSRAAWASGSVQVHPNVSESDSAQRVVKRVLVVVVTIF
jgi:hypothetical protein